MGVRSVTSQEVANDTLTTTTETVVCTVGPVDTGRRLDVHIRGWAQVTTGAATTALTPRIRRGTDITGTLIDEANAATIGAAAGGTEEVSVTARDEGADLAGAFYVMTVQQTAATGNGTALQAGMEATWSE